MTTETVSVEEHRVVSRAVWLEARKAHLAREREITHLRDQLHAERRALPWVRVEKDYRFEGPDGFETLPELFGGNSQLIVYHFMYGPGWEEGCPGCSFLSDHIDGANLHLAHHDVTLLAVSRAPFAEFVAFKQRMGWQFKWVSSHGSDFNFDFDVSFTKESLAKGPATYNFEPKMTQEPGEAPGLSVFSKGEDGSVFHTFSAYARGLDILLNTHNYLDFTPKGRNESSTMDWVRHHDKYAGAEKGHSCCSGSAE